jgi:hypothetical protein
VAPHATRLAPALALVLALSGCGVPMSALPPEPGDPTPTGGTPLAAADTGGTVLIAQLRVLDAAVAEVIAALDAAAAAAARGDLDAARAAGAAAVLRLLGDDDRAGLLPAVDPDRAAAGTSDLVSGTVTLAGDVGGERSRIVLELIRDPLVGDLGAWQRDPVGVVALLRSVALDAGPGPAELDAGLEALPGELTRALGYALAVEAAPTPELAVHAAAAASARLGVVRIALDLGVEALRATAADPTVGADAADGR